MNIKEEDFKLPSHSMESNDGNSERLQPPAPKRIKTITPFEDRPNDEDTVNLHSESLQPPAPERIKTITPFEDRLDDEDTVNLHSERLQPPAPERIKTITPFEDRLDDEDTVNLHSSTNIEDQVLKSPPPSECGSGVLSPDDEQKPWLSNGFIRIPDVDMKYENIKKKLVSTLSSCGFSAQEISEILSYGFGLPSNNGVYGYGVYLSTVDHPLESFQSSTADEDGLRHMLLCRVLLGSMEVICPGSRQYHPSSEEFDSGVDDLSSPKKYIVWTTKMNTHILPDFVIGYRISSCCSGYQKILQPPKQPTSDWMHLDTLINALPKFLPADAIKSLSEHHRQYKKQKITRHAMIQRLRHVVGDDLLLLMIKSYGEKIKASAGSNTDDQPTNGRI
ncbi:putative inactive poly [ADP-ribose] polymerase SRO5 [Sesamum angolense]|uniref:Inactive poly [ADP-ribose] polymerase SRO5 n=1 Tax=Sesamum angolense TaxID=2727404 RepID=A0AAE1WJV4_9LAMI|nr:putative inactive poly [ADP-ribose] polymerase SRO5 [Sesamum angolense]